METDSRIARWTRRMRFDTPRRRIAHAIVAATLLLGGLSLAILNGAAPVTRVSTLATSGSFFALAESGNTLYAASDNGGSVLLEKSTDRGADWTSSAVPYSAVAGGAPWTNAAVAVDGTNLLLTAATGSPGSFGIVPYYAGGGCMGNSTILLASSSNGGRAWSTSTIVTPGAVVTSIQAGIDGSSAAVGWVGEQAPCNASVGVAGAVTSGNAGRTWSSAQTLSAPGKSIPVGERIEMAPATSGIVIAIGLTDNASSESELALWSYLGSAASGFSPTGVFPAPTSWTLQGSPTTPAYLLTPTYLIPLTFPPYTALPFDELQSDSSSIGALPTVVSVVPIGSGDLEVAATTSDDLGVDCWKVNLTQPSVSQTCHVALGSLLLASDQLLPIVALIDSGGWWVAIGAAGATCLYACPPGYSPGTEYPPSASSPGAVGTSVCFTGCSSAQGLVAYSYSGSSTASHATVNAIAAGLAASGLLWLVAAVIARRRIERGASTPGGSTAPTPDDVAEPAERRWVRRVYRWGLWTWLVAWTPLGFLTYFGGAGSDASLTVWVVVLSGGIGALVALPFHLSVRTRLQKMHGINSPVHLWEPDSEVRSRNFQEVQRASFFAYGSWAAALAAVIVAWVDLLGGGRSSGGSSASLTEAPQALLGFALATLLGLFVLLRALYNYYLAAAVAGPPTERSTMVRTVLGAFLLPLNPLVGLLFGVAFASSTSLSPYGLAWVFLPVTLLGILSLSGCFGRTAWCPESSDGTSPPEIGESSPGVPAGRASGG